MLISKIKPRIFLINRICIIFRVYSTVHRRIGGLEIKFIICDMNHVAHPLGLILMDGLRLMTWCLFPVWFVMKTRTLEVVATATAFPLLHRGVRCAIERGHGVRWVAPTGVFSLAADALEMCRAFFLWPDAGTRKPSAVEVAVGTSGNG
jgi:hypothetical protein